MLCVSFLRSSGAQAELPKPSLSSAWAKKGNTKHRLDLIGSARIFFLLFLSTKIVFLKILYLFKEWIPHWIFSNIISALLILVLYRLRGFWNFCFIDILILNYSSTLGMWTRLSFDTPRIAAGCSPIPTDTTAFQGRVLLWIYCLIPGNCIKY